MGIICFVIYVGSGFVDCFFFVFRLFFWSFLKIFFLDEVTRGILVGLRVF